MNRIDAHVSGAAGGENAGCRPRDIITAKTSSKCRRQRGFSFSFFSILILFFLLLYFALWIPWSGHPALHLLPFYHFPLSQFPPLLGQGEKLGFSKTVIHFEDRDSFPVQAFLIHFSAFYASHVFYTQDDATQARAREHDSGC
ncbi:uncharacterized protein UV8b_02000 [Ustilaginoidea virens]|uniref:Uncharacterized protein n=1 Tax=Ustilaginoidea virens TaxID=1159556 RepID=A0A8E5HMM6_USTVR|nr:uncharacterized protein UV8b_02000 [Ustilaginoidea virens]QUC17759.1 hypothetical protein UV8b_02000 [Ustilaginoidea virens]